jgi:hypothetical protein
MIKRSIDLAGCVNLENSICLKRLLGFKDSASQNPRISKSTYKS